ncbi:UDP-N-acetylmuramate--L-alanine ligase [Candidatus Parcubacteria bacterium]|nr:MAG: UDP-N-acetylmuramate--L-alanine ligase [Candidatus Parcubacteria bacterium]
MPKKHSPLVHFIGIGGIGVSSLARWFSAQKWAISGSDIAESSITQGLRKEGYKVKIGHKRRNLSPRAGLVIYNQAIPESNPERRASRRFKIPMLSYPQAIGILTHVYKTVAIAGAHGKSTTTALATLILQKGGLDPTVIIGTNLKEFGSKNFRIGRSSYLILEADEWKGSFWHYSPFVSVVTNIDNEHLDFYKNLTNVKRSFLRFLGHTKDGGVLILNRDDQNLVSLRRKITSIARKKNLRIRWYTLEQSEARKIKSVIRIPGSHNISNALAALTVGQVFRIPEKKILRAISSYRGAWRRMEYRGKFHRALVFDDYAHHPTEIKATIKAFREKYPEKTILCVFQPHQAKRLAKLFKEFQTAFDAAHETLILPSYEVPGRDTRTLTHDAKELVRAIQKQQPKKLIFYLEKPENLAKAVSALRSPLPRKIIIMMGAGDIANYTKLLLEK